MNRIKKFVSKLLKDLFNEQDKKELIEILTTSLQEKVDEDEGWSTLVLRKTGGH